MDYVSSPAECIEVKLGQASPVEFAWFSRSFPRARLTVITSTPFAAERVTGVTMARFLEAEA